MKALARVEGLGVSYRDRGGQVPALAGIDLTLFEGERLAIIGESGSGKSTFALALAGLLPEGARVSGRIDWPELGRAPQNGKDIGFVFQDPGSSLDPVMTIGEQIAEVARRHRVRTWPEAYDIARQLLERVHLPQPAQAMHAYPHQLSGGQRQRVAIAAAIAGGPKLLIADEATSALDTIVQAEIVALLDELVRDEGMTLLFVTHDMALAAQLAERIAVFRGARLVEMGATAELLERPRDDYTRQLIAAHVGLDDEPLIGVAR
jgi:peptide/nickel transport system ATP-binding protein